MRNDSDGYNTEHQNPEYELNNPNYAYVQVTNNRRITCSGTDDLKLYWAKANTALSWPDHWEGDLYMTDPITEEEVLMGDEVGALTIPPLEIGESKVLEFEWNVPNPENYVNINNNPWHFCLLARIESTDDSMTFPEGGFITTNVKNNNNIAWKNMTVVDIVANVSSPIQAAVAVENPFNQTTSFNLEFVKETEEFGKALYDKAEISIIMDDIVYKIWENSGKNSTNFLDTGQANKIIDENN